MIEIQAFQLQLRILKVQSRYEFGTCKRKLATIRHTMVMTAQEWSSPKWIAESKIEAHHDRKSNRKTVSLLLK